MSKRIAACACGQVEIEATGDPIVTVVCYCDDCQEGGRQIEALPGSPSVLDRCGGTPLALFRTDRVACVKGPEFLEGYKLKPDSITNRRVAGCCNSPMVIDFDRGMHWNTIFLDRFANDAPSADMRVQTRFATDAPDGGLPAYRKFPMSMVAKIIRARIAMIFSR